MSGYGRALSACLLAATLAGCWGPPSPPPHEATTAAAEVEFVAPVFRRPDGGLTIRAFLVRPTATSRVRLKRCELSLFDDRNRDGTLDATERIADFYEVLEPRPSAPTPLDLSGLGWALPAALRSPVVEARIQTDTGAIVHHWAVRAGSP